jgi:hypothetical protein
MIIASLAGGLGNQLFQYAMGRRLAVRHSTELLLDVSNYAEATPAEKAAGLARRVHLFNFRIHARPATEKEINAMHDRYCTKRLLHRAVRLIRRGWPGFLWRRTHIMERQYRFQSEALHFPDNIYLAGFWQSEKYFADIAPIIRDEFELVDDSIADSARGRIRELRDQYGTVVSLHVRRGDLSHAFETLGQGHLVHGPPMGVDYYERAIAEFDPSCCFFVFSDSSRDIEWCRQHLKAANLEFSNAESELWDFEAMRNCDHHIISNSTFSWWAAWLNSGPQRKVIAPRMWSGQEARTQMVTDDLIPPGWEVI